MEHLKKELDYALVIYDDDGTVIEKLDGPGDYGMWLSDPERGPLMAAMMIIDPGKVKDLLDKSGVYFYKAGRIPFDQHDKEHPELEEPGVLILEQSLEKSKSLAKDFGLEFIYWMDYDPGRYIDVVSVSTKETELYANCEIG